MAAPRNIVVSVIFRIVVIVVCLGVAIGIYNFLVTTAPKPPAAELANVVPRVVVMRAQPVPVQRQWNGFGTAESMESANVPSRVTSTVIARPDEIRPGRAVTKGQMLVELDASDFVRQVEIASEAIEDIQAQLQRLEVEEQSARTRMELAAQDAQLARADLQRVQEALARDAARQREVDQAQQAFNAAQRTEEAARETLNSIPPRRASLRAQLQREQANLRLANQNVERSQIASPIDGILQSVDVEVGENVTAGQSVARVVNLSRIEVPLLLTSAARPFVNVGDRAALARPGSAQNWDATVTRIAPEDEQATRTMRVFVEVSQSAHNATLAPGQFVQATVYSGELVPTSIVPRRSVNRERIMLIEDGRVTSRMVDVAFSLQGEFPLLGLPDTQWLALSQPLPPEAMVVVDASRTLIEGGAAVPVIAGEANGQIAARRESERRESEARGSP